MKATGLRFVTLFAAGAMLVAGSLLSARTASADGDALKSALDDYAAGKYEDALKKLQAYVASNPGDEEVYGVLRNADEKVLLQTLAKGGENERLMRYLMDKARPVSEAKKRDPERIKKLADDAVNGALDVRRRADLDLARTAGEYAVPALLGSLANPDAEKVVNAMFALQAIGGDAVLPLTAAMNSSDARLRGFVAAVLGDLKDPRAMPVLRRATEKDADEGVKAKAAAAIQRIRGSAAAMPAVESYVRLGNLYYSDDPSVLSSADETANDWRWEGDGLVRYEVPHAMLNEVLAEHCAADALALDASNMGARSLMVRSVLSLAIEGKAMGDKAPESVKGAHDLAASQGFDAASGALNDALGAHDWDVAVDACGLVADTYGKQDLKGHPLGRALVATERRVQYAAAVAALRMSPSSPFENSGQVPALAAQAASETALRQVFVLDDHDDARGRLTQALREAGYVVSEDADGYRGAARIKAAPTIDVVVVRADLGSAGDIPSNRWRSTLAIIDELLADARTKNMKIVVVAGADLSEGAKKMLGDKYGEKIADWITEPIEAAAVMPKMEAIAAKADVNRERELAVKTAAGAADAFAVTNAHCTAWDFKVAIDPLANNAQEGASDEVKMNAVRALGNLRAGGGAALAAILKSADAKEDLKVAAAKALGAVLGAMGPVGDEVDALTAAAKAGGAVGSAAMQALGMVKGLTPDQAKAAWADHRLDVGKKAD